MYVRCHLTRSRQMAADSPPSTNFFMIQPNQIVVHPLRCVFTKHHMFWNPSDHVSNGSKFNGFSTVYIRAHQTSSKTRDFYKYTYQEMDYNQVWLDHKKNVGRGRISRHLTGSCQIASNIHIPLKKNPISTLIELFYSKQILF